jgi:hypothetical protein
LHDYRHGVMSRAFPALLVFACISCQERKSEIVVTETRPITTKDVAPKIDASSDERFRDARPSPVQGTAPDGWLALPSTQMRILNYRFGESGLGEAYVSLSAGSILDNANRWLGQYSAPSIDAAALEKLPRLPIASTSGILVTASGTYASGMGAPPRDGYGLAGIIADIDGQILTIKLVGPDAEVRSAIPALESFAKNLKWNGANSVSGH